MFITAMSFFHLQIIQQYKEILHRNQFNLHDKGKLKSVLAGLAYCLSLLPCNKTDDNSSTINVLFNTLMLYDSSHPCTTFSFTTSFKVVPTSNFRLLYSLFRLPSTTGFLNFFSPHFSSLALLFPIGYY